MDRRSFLSLPLAAAAVARPATESFTFVHFTDPHIQPELRAREGVEKAFASINEIKADFALGGGDLVFDVLESTPQRAKMLFDMYESALKGLKLKVYQVPGNHDVYGWSVNSPISLTDPMYGKKMYEDRLGPRYSSFDHKGWHFVLLDSIGVENRRYIGLIDQEQMDWLKRDLEKTGKTTPVVVLTHIPLTTGIIQFLSARGGNTDGWAVTNSRDVLALLEQYNVKAVLQGHTHVRETLDYKGCQYITSGAVSGNWWKGERLGHPEGFAVLTVKGDTISWEYKTYGWKAAVS
jgi:Icc protein